MSTITTHRRRSLLRMPSTYAYAAVAAFVVGNLLAIRVGDYDQSLTVGGTRAAMHLAFFVLHLLLLPVISALPAPDWGRVAGYVWVLVDNMIILVEWHSLGAETTEAMRWGVHTIAAVWVLSAAASGRGWLRWLGLLSGLLLGGFSFAAVWVPEPVFRAIGPLFIVWLVLVGRHLASTQDGDQAAAVDATVPR